MSTASLNTGVPVREVAPLFAALGDETRLQLLGRLSTQGPGSIARLHERSKVTRQAITKHLEVLLSVGLLRSTRKGRERIWDLKPQRLADAQDYIERISREWDAALERLKLFVESDAAPPKKRRTK